jgi:hypothetical protein
VIERARPGRSIVAIVQKMGESGRSSGYSFTQAQRVELEPGKTARVTIGGMGRPVVGRMVAPAAVAERIDWYYAHTGLSTKVEFPRPTLPADWAQMDKPAQDSWMKAWQERPEVKQAHEKYSRELEQQRYFPVAIGRDGSFRVEDVPAGVYGLHVHVSAPPTRDTVGGDGTLAIGRVDVTVPDMPGGRSDEPLDLGKIELKQPPKEQR